MISVVHLISGSWDSIMDVGEDESKQNKREKATPLPYHSRKIQRKVPLPAYVLWL